MEYDKVRTKTKRGSKLMKHPLAECLIPVDGCWLGIRWSNPGPGTKLPGRFGHEKRVPVRFQVGKPVPVQYPTTEHYA